MLGNILFLICGRCTSIQNEGTVYNSKLVQFTKCNHNSAMRKNFPITLKIRVFFASEIHPLPVENSWDA